MHWDCKPELRLFHWPVRNISSRDDTTFSSLMSLLGPIIYSKENVEVCGCLFLSLGKCEELGCVGEGKE